MRALLEKKKKNKRSQGCRQPPSGDSLVPPPRERKERDAPKLDLHWPYRGVLKGEKKIARSRDRQGKTVV